jgi:hypothetical protein
MAYADSHSRKESLQATLRSWVRPQNMTNCNMSKKCPAQNMNLKCLREYSGVLDTAVTKAKSLPRYLGYGEDSHLEQRLDGVVFVDRGYNVASVTRLFFWLRCQILRTHFENAGKWPFCTGGNPKHWQILVPIEWALPFVNRTT